MSTDLEIYPDITLLDYTDGTFRWKCSCGIESMRATDMRFISASAVAHDESHRG